MQISMIVSIKIPENGEAIFSPEEVTKEQDGFTKLACKKGKANEQTGRESQDVSSPREDHATKTQKS